MVCRCLLDTVLPELKLWEYYSVDVDVIVQQTSNYQLYRTVNIVD